MDWRVSMKVKWNKYNPKDKENTAPTELDTLVWIVEENYDLERLGYFDGFTFRIWSGSDDCSVTHWAEIEYPDYPKEDE